MPFGTVLAKAVNAATSGTPASHPKIRQGMPIEFETYIWTVWVIEEGKAHPYSHHIDENVALATATSFQGVVTKAPLVADYRNRRSPVAVAPVVSAQHKCDSCGKVATHCYREGAGTGHSEHVCACIDHKED